MSLVVSEDYTRVQYSRGNSDGSLSDEQSSYIQDQVFYSCDRAISTSRDLEHNLSQALDRFDLTHTINGYRFTRFRSQNPRCSEFQVETHLGYTFVREILRTIQNDWQVTPNKKISFKILTHKTFKLDDTVGTRTYRISIDPPLCCVRPQGENFRYLDRNFNDAPPPLPLPSLEEAVFENAAAAADTIRQLDFNEVIDSAAQAAESLKQVAKGTLELVSCATSHPREFLNDLTFSAQIALQGPLDGATQFVQRSGRSLASYITNPFSSASRAQQPQELTTSAPSLPMTDVAQEKMIELFKQSIAVVKNELTHGAHKAAESAELAARDVVGACAAALLEMLRDKTPEEIAQELLDLETMLQEMDENEISALGLSPEFLAELDNLPELPSFTDEEIGSKDCFVIIPKLTPGGEPVILDEEDGYCTPPQQSLSEEEADAAQQQLEQENLLIQGIDAELNALPTPISQRFSLSEGYWPSSDLPPPYPEELTPLTPTAERISWNIPFNVPNTGPSFEEGSESDD